MATAISDKEASLRKLVEAARNADLSVPVDFSRFVAFDLIDLLDAERAENARLRAEIDRYTTPEGITERLRAILTKEGA